MENEIKEFKCSVCGAKSKHTVITKIQVNGAPDMDFRPPAPHRSTMEYWVMECPECHYCNGSIDIPLKADKSYLDSDEYKMLDGLKTENPLVSKFVRKAIVCMKNKDYKEAVQSYLYGAWVCDDNRNIETGLECRKKALNIMENSTILDDDNFLLLRADLLRRTGQFDKVVSDYGEKFFNVPLMLLASQYQVKLAKNKDILAHKMSEIPGVKYELI